MERADAYRRKIAVILDGLAKVESLEGLTELEQEGVLHVVQVAVDAAMDLVAMKVRDLGHQPSDDYHNLQTLQDDSFIDAKLADGLRSLNGLRNAIVHRYNSFEAARVHDSMDEIQALLHTLAQRME